MLDLKDAFFTIPLRPNDRPCFAFSVPSLNFRQLLQRYLWNVSPEGMASTPNLCQDFVGHAIASVHGQFSTASIIPYVDDILLVATEETELLQLFAQIEFAL